MLFIRRWWRAVDHFFVELLLYFVCYYSDTTTRKRSVKWRKEIVNNAWGIGRWVKMADKFPIEFNNNALRYKWTNLIKYNHVLNEGGSGFKVKLIINLICIFIIVVCNKIMN